MTIIHNHGAAVSGTKSEKELCRITQSVGFAYLKVKEDFEKRGLSEWGRRYHKPPKLWNQKTKKGKQRQNKAKQGKERQKKAKQSKTRQSEAKQCKARQSKQK